MGDEEDDVADIEQRHENCSYERARADCSLLCSSTGVFELFSDVSIAGEHTLIKRCALIPQDTDEYTAGVLHCGSSTFNMDDDDDDDEDEFSCNFSSDCNVDLDFSSSPSRGGAMSFV